MERKNKIIKTLKNMILFIFLIVLTFSIIFKDQDITQILEVVKSVKKEYLLIAVLCMCVYLSCEAIDIGRTLKALGEKTTFLKNLRYALIGFFFSSITPAASGGQPMQIYFMHKDNINVAHSTLALLINLTCMQIVTISIALFSLFFNYGYMNSAMKIFFVIGVGLNLSALTLLLISIYLNGVSKGLIGFAVKVLRFLKIKNVDEVQEKLNNELNKYQESAKYIRNNRRVTFRILLTTYFQFIVFYSISYFVYLSFGLNELNAFQIITVQSVLYATVSGIPSPGAVGVSEGGFLALYSTIYTEKMLGGAMLLSRGINFYLFVIISSFVSIGTALRGKRIDKRENEKNVINENNAENKEIAE